MPCNLRNSARKEVGLNKQKKRADLIDGLLNEGHSESRCSFSEVLDMDLSTTPVPTAQLIPATLTNFGDEPQDGATGAHFLHFIHF